MAKTTRKVVTEKSEPVEVATVASDETRLEAFAEDLGDLLGQAQGKAESWLGQRKAIAEHLIGVRDTATKLLAQLGIADGPAPGRTSRTKGAEPGEVQPMPLTKKKRRKMSAQARARIAAAQRARWARWKKAATRG
jgi:hypothetical protein